MSAENQRRGQRRRDFLCNLHKTWYFSDCNGHGGVEPYNKKAAASRRMPRGQLHGEIIVNTEVNMSREKQSHSSPQEQLPAISIAIEELSTNRVRYIVYPPYQRQVAWSLVMRQAYIDTILRGDPSPPLEGYEHLDGAGKRYWEISDGRQRITAILDFLDGKFKTWTVPQKERSEPNSEPPVEPGQFFHQLDPRTQNYVAEYRLHIHRLHHRTEQEKLTRFRRTQNHSPSLRQRSST